MDQLQKILQVKNQTPNSADLYFYGDIVSDWWGAWTESDQYPEAIKNFLNGQEGKDLNIYINSGGGSVFASLAIYNMLKRHTGKKTVTVDGVAASGASVIAMAGDEIIIPENAFLMIHRAWVDTTGNAEELRACADYLDRLDEGILSVYTDNLLDGVNEEDIRRMVNAETWLTGAEAAQYFRVSTGKPINAVSCISEQLTQYKHTPPQITATISKEHQSTEIKANDSLDEQKREQLKRLVLQGLTI